jgi:hypothetical protein
MLPLKKGSIFCRDSEGQNMLPSSDSLLAQRKGHIDGASDGAANHGVVAHAEIAHHLNVCGNGRGTCKLGVGVHTAHGVGHAVRSGTCSHVVGMKCTSRAATAGYGEVRFTGQCTRSFL